MRTILASILLFAATALPALGTPYRGSITQTVTSTNTPIYYVGETFWGFYEYDSHGPDGTFYLRPEQPIDRPPVNESLGGAVYLTFFEELTDGFAGGWFNSLESTERRQAYLTVSGGRVTDFHWQYWEFGSADFETSGFDTWNFQDFETSGSLSFGAPTQVPDSTPTIWPLAAALCACFCRYAWVKKHLRSSLLRPLS